MYVEIQSAKGGTNRSELNRLIEDCQTYLLDVVVTRDVSCFGRDTVETLEAYRAIRQVGVRVILKKMDWIQVKTPKNLFYLFWKQYIRQIMSLAV